MDKKFYWSYMMYLSCHMWGDESSPTTGWYLPPRYDENNNTNVGVWDDMVKYLAEHGSNH